MKECHSWSFIDSTTFCLDYSVLNLITHPEAMTSTDSICFYYHFDDACIGFFVYFYRYSLFEFYSYYFIFYFN